MGHAIDLVEELPAGRRRDAEGSSRRRWVGEGKETGGGSVVEDRVERDGTNAPPSRQAACPQAGLSGGTLQQT